MTIEEILDRLDDTLDDAWSLPLSGGRIVIDVDKIREYLDDVRLNLPTEIKQAKAIVADRSDIITAARREADGIVEKAEQRAQRLIDNEEIVKQATLKANEIVLAATTKAREIKQASVEYSENAMKRAEDVLLSSYNDIKSIRIALRKKPTEGEGQ